jgi:adenine-specific DNA-methyltransferase
LIVDEDSFNDIKPLPNLDYKIVRGNSLIGFPNNWRSDIADKIEKLEDKLFSETHPERKKEIKKELDALILKRLENSEKNFGYKVDFDFKLFFPQVYHNQKVFKEKSGFDIVIGNPPYIKEYINRNAFDNIRNSECYKGKSDIWYLFVCKGAEILRDKGILTFIAPNNWTTNYGASKMRNKVIKEFKILELIDFGPYFIFETSKIQTMVMFFQKITIPNEYYFDFRRIIGKKPTFKDVLDLLKKTPNHNNEYLTPKIIREKYLDKPLTFSKTDVGEVLNKIENNAKERLHKREIANGIHSHHDKVTNEMLKKLGKEFKIGDGIFVLSEEEKNRLRLSEKELELLKPYYISSELKKYYSVRKNSQWIIYTDSRFKNPKAIEPYPNIKKHLDKYQAVITSDNKPYGLHRARDERFFKGEKIIALRKCTEPIFTYTDFDCYVSAAFYVIKTNRFNMKYLTGLLNSRLVAFWLRHKGKMQGNNYQIDAEPLLNIPLPSLASSNQPIADQIIQKVDQILTLTQSKDYDTNQAKQEHVKRLEHEIDKLVYKLYGLTEEEIKIIEGS